MALLTPLLTVFGLLPLACAFAASGTASFTSYTGCGSNVACGITGGGLHTAALNQLNFGAGPGQGAGPGCGRCFQLTGTADPFSPNYQGPFNSIKVKINNLCPAAGNEEWCGQTSSNPVNQHGVSSHFDICNDDGGASAFFPSGHGALTGTFTEVSC